MDDKLFPVGGQTERFDAYVSFELPEGNVYQSKGLEKHISKKHPDCMKYLDRIPEILNEPDYIGVNPKIPNSFELVKILDANIQIAINLDLGENYLYVASLYDISDSKLRNRVNSGRYQRL